MDISPVTIFNVIVGIIIAIISYALYRRMNATDPDGEIDIFTYGQIVLQAEQTARIIVRGVQEAWRTGELEDDEREDDAIDQLTEMYPVLDEETVRRIVKSAVYLLRLGAGKHVDRVMEQIPDHAQSQIPSGVSDSLGHNSTINTKLGASHTQEISAVSQPGAVDSLLRGTSGDSTG